MAVFTKQRLFVAIFAMFIISTILYISRNKSDIMEGTLENCLVSTAKDLIYLKIDGRTTNYDDLYEVKTI
jgi:hypothetical protein